MLADSNHQRSLRETPSFFVMAFNVVRGSVASLVTPPVSRSTPMICSRSTCAKRSAADGLLCIGPYFGQGSTKVGAGKGSRTSQ